MYTMYKMYTIHVVTHIFRWYREWWLCFHTLILSQMYLWFSKFIPTWPVTISPKSQINFIIWFLIDYLHQSFCKLNYGNLKNLWNKTNTYSWKSFFITATLGPLSGYHDLIWKQWTTFYYSVLKFLSWRILVSVWLLYIRY